MKRKRGKVIHLKLPREERVKPPGIVIVSGGVEMPVIGDVHFRRRDGAEFRVTFEDMKYLYVHATHGGFHQRLSIQVNVSNSLNIGMYHPMEDE